MHDANPTQHPDSADLVVRRGPSASAGRLLEHGIRSKDSHAFFLALRVPPNGHKALRGDLILHPQLDTVTRLFFRIEMDMAVVGALPPFLPHPPGNSEVPRK